MGDFLVAPLSPISSPKGGALFGGPLLELVLHIGHHHVVEGATRRRVLLQGTGQRGQQGRVEVQPEAMGDRPVVCVACVVYRKRCFNVCSRLNLRLTMLVLFEGTYRHSVNLKPFLAGNKIKHPFVLYFISLYQNWIQ